jgi:hypothetical protein
VDTFHVGLGVLAAQWEQAVGGTKYRLDGVHITAVVWLWRAVPSNPLPLSLWIRTAAGSLPWRCKGAPRGGGRPTRRRSR